MPLVFVGIKSEPGQSEAVKASLSEADIVQEAHTVYSGVYDVVVMIEIPDLDAYHNFVQRVLATHPGIADFESFISV